MIGNTFYNSGGGRWIFRQGPDLIIRGDGSPELVGSASTIDGIEYQATPKTMIYAYYGGAYFEERWQVIRQMATRLDLGTQVPP